MFFEQFCNLVVLWCNYVGFWKTTEFHFLQFCKLSLTWMPEDKDKTTYFICGLWEVIAYYRLQTK